MDFNFIVKQILQEESATGGADSVFGAGVQATAQAFSGDSYAPGDARTPKSIFGGVITRRGMRKNHKKKSKKKYRKNY